MTNAMLSEYTNGNGTRVAVAVFSGCPLCAETDVATARAVLLSAVARHPGHVNTQHWDGDTSTLSAL